MTMWERVGAGPMLNQLAEECCELAQAALKYRRCIEEGNPTPVSEEEARKNLMEEIADVWLCTDLVPLTSEECDTINSYMNMKYDRWENRLNQEGDNADE